MFSSMEVCPGVWHIQDGGGCCQTLIAGSSRALLFDAGYGYHDISAFVRTLTALPLTVILSHGHHDHVLGARFFPETYMFAEDEEDFLTYTGTAQRRRVLAQADARGLTDIDRDAFLTDRIPMPKPLQQGEIDLGRLHVQIIRCPGHTPGSAILLVKERRLLCTADDWNPCTWLFFPKAEPLQVLRENMRRQLQQLDFTHVLCSHQHRLYERYMVDDFYAELTDEHLRIAYVPDMEQAATLPLLRCDVSHDQFIVFDADKYRGYRP